MTGKTPEDWIDRQQRTPRPLPITVAPAHNETLESYLDGLAAANRITVEHLHERLAGSKADPIQPGRLALLSGQSIRTLAHALHEIAGPDGGLHPGMRPETGRSGLRRRPCAPCAISRGHLRPITCWTDHHDAVCLRHARWLGDGRTPSAAQLDLRAHPQILRANRLHRRLVRSFGLDACAHAYRRAAWIVARWHGQLDYDEGFHHHMGGFHGPTWQVGSNHPTIGAATYPQTVALTRLLASPHWQSISSVRPEPTEFITELRRTVAPGYHWSLMPHHRAHDPLVAALCHNRPTIDEVT